MKLTWLLKHAVSLAGVLFVLLATRSALAQGTVLFDTHNDGVNARVWHPERCEPVTGEEFVAQLYIQRQGAGYFEAIGVPVAFGTGAEAGYVHGGEVVVPLAAPGTTLEAVMRFWQAGFDSYEQTMAAGGWHGQSMQVTVLLGGVDETQTPHVTYPAGRLYLMTLWGACPSGAAVNIELGESTVKLLWELRGFGAGNVVVPQEADSPAGPWRDIEGPWKSEMGRTNPPNPLTLQKPNGAKYYRMRVTTMFGP